MKGSEIIALWNAAEEAVCKGGAPSGGEMGYCVRGRYDVLYDGCSVCAFREKRLDIGYSADCTRVPHRWTLRRVVGLGGGDSTPLSEIDPQKEYNVGVYKSVAEAWVDGEIDCHRFAVVDSGVRSVNDRTRRFDTFEAADAFARRLAQRHMDDQRRDATYRKHTPLRLVDNVQRARERGELRHYDYYVYDGRYNYSVAVGCDGDWERNRKEVA